MNPIWYEHYPPEVPTDITDKAQSYPSLVALFEESFTRFSRCPAYTSMGTTISYGELDQASRCFAAWLQSIGIKRATASPS